MTPSVTLYGLLHVGPAATRHANLRGSADDSLDIYLRCAAACARSVERHGYRFRLATNDAARLTARQQAIGVHPLDIVEIAFTRDVPPGIPFYSAHFKLDMFAALGTETPGDAIVGLIDIDTILTRPFDGLDTLGDSLLVYDITDQEEEAHGIPRLRDDIARVAGIPIDAPRWYGGEFFLGAPPAFARLATYVDRCWPAYVAGVGTFHHSGDEMPTAAAIALMHRDGLPVVDAGRTGAVARWWSCRTRHRQRPFAAVMGSSLLHLPADKPFLARYGSDGINLSAFVAEYRANVRRKLVPRRIKAVLTRLLRRSDGQHVPRLGAAQRSLRHV